MSDQVTLATDFPGAPKGTVLTKGIDGRYYHDSGLWMDAEPVEADPGRFLLGVVPPPDIPDEIQLYIVQGDGSVSKQSSGGTKPPINLAPNVFLNPKDAEVIAAKFREILVVTPEAATEVVAAMEAKA